jgi:hypothetical protein
MKDPAVPYLVYRSARHAEEAASSGAERDEPLRGREGLERLGARPAKLGNDLVE